MATITITIIITAGGHMVTATVARARYSASRTPSGPQALPAAPFPLKGAPAEADAPCERAKITAGLHLFLCARVGRRIPRAASLGAVGCRLCGFYVLGKSRARESKCESYG